MVMSDLVLAISIAYMLSGWVLLSGNKAGAVAIRSSAVAAIIMLIVTDSCDVYRIVPHQYDWRFWSSILSMPFMVIDAILPKIIEMMADLVSYRPELLRLIAVAFVELEWKAEAFCEEHLAPELSAINHYFKMSIKSGRIRDLDPTMLTAALMTTALVHPGISKLIEGQNPAH